MATRAPAGCCKETDAVRMAPCRRAMSVISVRRCRMAAIRSCGRAAVLAISTSVSTSSLMDHAASPNASDSPVSDRRLRASPSRFIGGDVAISPVVALTLFCDDGNKADPEAASINSEGVKTCPISPSGRGLSPGGPLCRPSAPVPAGPLHPPASSWCNGSVDIAQAPIRRRRKGGWGR